MNKAFNLYGSYTNPYLRFVKVDDSLVYNKASQALEESPDWADTAVSLGQKNASVNGWPVSVPDLPNGSYDVQLYDSAAPASTDAMIAGWRLIMPHQLIVNPTEFPLDVFGRIRTTSA